MIDEGLLKIHYQENPNDIVKDTLLRQLKKLEQKAGLEDDVDKGDQNGRLKKTLAV